MKTMTELKGNIRFILRKLGLLVFLSLLLVMSSCQYKKPVEFNVVMQDIIRKKHSKELLNRKSYKKNIKIFDGDASFYEYITEYLKQNNRKIDAEKFTQTLLALSKSHSYDPVFILAVIKTESAFDFNAIGSAGEIGLMQIKPDTAKWICDLKKITWKGPEALKDPEYNILVGGIYFKYLTNAVKSQSINYVNAYNLGLASMNRKPSSDLRKHPYLGKIRANYLAIYSDLKKIKKKKVI